MTLYKDTGKKESRSSDDMHNHLETRLLIRGNNTYIFTQLFWEVEKCLNKDQARVSMVNYTQNRTWNISN